MYKTRTQSFGTSVLIYPLLGGEQIEQVLYVAIEHQTGWALTVTVLSDQLAWLQNLGVHVLYLVTRALHLLHTVCYNTLTLVCKTNITRVLQNITHGRQIGSATLM